MSSLWRACLNHQQQDDVSYQLSILHCKMKFVILYLLLLSFILLYHFRTPKSLSCIANGLLVYAVFVYCLMHSLFFLPSCALPNINKHSNGITTECPSQNSCRSRIQSMMLHLSLLQLLM